MFAAFTMVLSGTIVNVAVPDVMGAFGVGPSEVQLMSTAFMISMTTGQLLNAWVVAVFGQRWGYMGTLALFTFGSLVAGAAESFDMVVFGRVLQGSAAGVIQPLVMVARRSASMSWGWSVRLQSDRRSVASRYSCSIGATSSMRR